MRSRSSRLLSWLETDSDTAALYSCGELNVSKRAHIVGNCGKNNLDQWQIALRVVGRYGFKSRDNSYETNAVIVYIVNLLL